MGSAHKEQVMLKEFTCDENFMQYIIGKGVMKLRKSFIQIPHSQFIHVWYFQLYKGHASAVP